jgi:hypothetical protein
MAKEGGDREAAGEGVGVVGSSCCGGRIETVGPAVWADPEGCWSEVAESHAGAKGVVEDNDGREEEWLTGAKEGALVRNTSSAAAVRRTRDSGS